MPWYVLYTKPRNEKKTAALLAERGFIVFCPMQETIKQWSDRKKKVSEPIFRSYLFVHLQDYNSRQVEVLTTPGAVRFLWWLGKPAIVRDEEIQAIRDFLDDYDSVALSISFTEGQAVTVAHGALQEQKGTIVRLKGTKATLLLTSLNWNITAELPLSHLKADT